MRNVALSTLLGVIVIAVTPGYALPDSAECRFDDAVPAECLVAFQLGDDMVNLGLAFGGPFGVVAGVMTGSVTTSTGERSFSCTGYGPFLSSCSQSSRGYFEAGQRGTLRAVGAAAVGRLIVTAD